jgi:hypothetical protein
MALFALVLRLFVLVLAGCALRDPPSTTVVAEPLPADPPITLDTMQVECDAMMAALAALRDCKYNEERDKREYDAIIEGATRTFAASAKVHPGANEQKAMAQACHRATASIRAKTERCNAAPPVKSDYQH